MSSLNPDKLLQITTSVSPKSTYLNYFPAGSFSSNQYSHETEENFSSKSSHKGFFSEENPSNASIELISYEAVSLSPSSHHDKEIQTADCTFSRASEVALTKHIEELQGTIEVLQQHCRTYEKQNESLRKELNAAAKEISENSKNALWSEIQKFKSKICMHEGMIGKVLAIAEDLCEEEPDFSRNISQMDLHAYNYLASKLEIVRYRMHKQATRIQQLEFEKNSVSEMLNYYIATDKIIDTQKNKNISSDDIISDYSNPGFSRKSSVLMESNMNSLITRTLDEEIYYKRPSSSASEVFEGQETMISRNTFSNLKGISNIAKCGGNNASSKTGHSYSVSPLIPKPKKKVVAGAKENDKSGTLKNSRNHEEPKKKNVFKLY